ncbi:hypothetical protein HS088_TW14G00913 [Tripterygium wilfordii]|uniref:Uncharacterized protein n=1 Tax=Tripterygium wilfordii TaxID=458696 RepID=A0A7J7CRP8_TRIWF|nr:hypothetical protein HS088_TW14G00913 [Tripterygium wilfordii]
MRGHLAVLNFPEEYPLGTRRGSSTSAAGSSSSSGRGREVIEFEYLDDKVLDELLEEEEKKSFDM